MKVYGFYTGNEVIEIGIDNDCELFVKHPKITDGKFKKFTSAYYSSDIEKRKKNEVMLRILKQRFMTYSEDKFDQYVIADIENKLGFEYIGKKDDTPK